MGITKARGASLRLDNRLADSTTGEGASLVAIEDAAANFVAGNVEDALAELATLIAGFLRATIDTAVSLSVVVADKNKLFNVTGTATLSLPPAATAGEGFVLAAFNASTTSTDVVTLDASGMEVINNALTVTLAKGEWCILTCTGAQWKALIYAPPSATSLPTALASYKYANLLQDYGDGADGAFNSVGSATLAAPSKSYTTFALNVGHTLTIPASLTVLRASTSITIDGTLDFDYAVQLPSDFLFFNLTSPGPHGSGGGGGGGGGAGGGGAAGLPGVIGNSSKFIVGGAGGNGGGSGNSGVPGTAGAIATADHKKILPQLLMSLLGLGSAGGAGGDSGTNAVGGTGGAGGAGLLILIAPSITLSGTSIVTSLGANGANGASQSGTDQSGGGGGGGASGGVLILSSPTISDASTKTLTGGAGGAGGTGGSGGTTGGAGGAGADGYTLQVDPTA